MGRSGDGKWNILLGWPYCLGYFMRIWAQIFFTDDINLPRIWLEAHGNKQHKDGLNTDRDMAYSSKCVTTIVEYKFRLGTYSCIYPLGFAKVFPTNLASIGFFLAWFLVCKNSFMLLISMLLGYKQANCVNISYMNSIIHAKIMPERTCGSSRFVYWCLSLYNV